MTGWLAWLTALAIHTLRTIAHEYPKVGSYGVSRLSANLSGS